jgi:Immunoglobulin I-set domain
MKKTLTQISRFCRPVVGETFRNQIKSWAFAFLAVAACLSGTSARAQWVVNYDFNWTNNVTYASTGVLGTGSYWNGFSVPATFAYPAITYTNSAGISDDGVTNRGVVLTISTYTSYGSSGVNSLLDDWFTAYSWDPARPFSLTNLPAGLYNLACYAVDGTYANRLTTFTINGASQTCTNTAGVADTSFVQNNNYVLFSGLLVTNSGISGTFTSPLTNSEGDFNGLQLQYLGSNVAPIIVSAPASRTAVQGSAATFSVTAVGYPLPLSYHWQFSPDNVTFTNLINGANVSGATSNILTLPHVAINQAGYYQVVVTNTAGSVTSASVQLTVNTLAAPWTVNFDFDNYAGGFVGTFSGVGVEGSGTYWNSIDGGGSYNAGTSYSLGGLLDDGSTDSGVTATVSAGGAYSSNPVNNALLDDYAFTKSGAYAFSFANLPDGVYDVVLYGIPGGNAAHPTGTTFTLNGLSLSDSNTGSDDTGFIQGDNYVRYPGILVQGGTLSGIFAPAPGKTEGDFNGAQLRYLGGTNLVVAPIVLVAPVSQTNYQNFASTFTVTASGNPLSYQWQFSTNGTTYVNLANTNNISGANTSTLTITNTALNQAGYYRVNVSNSGGATNSVATLTVQPLATPWVVNFDYNASGSNPPTQWMGTFGNLTGTNQLWFPYLSSTNATYWNAVFGPSNLNQHVVTTSSSAYGNYLGGYPDDPALAPLGPFGIVCNVTGFGTSVSNRPTGYGKLLDDYCFGGIYSGTTYGGSFEITNLPAGYYNLVLFGVDGGNANYSTTFTIGATNQTCVNGTNADSYLGLNDNYVVFNNLAVSASGKISGTFLPSAATNSPPEGAFCGAQLQYVGPTLAVGPVYINAQTVSGGKIVLQWSSGALQTNANLSNPLGWGTVTGATSPYTNSTPNLPKLFYRVLVQ